jgi:hypothetical protein
MERRRPNRELKNSEDVQDALIEDYFRYNNLNPRSGLFTNLWLCSADQVQRTRNLGFQFQIYSLTYHLLPDLDSIMARFFLCVLKKDGTEYEPDSLGSMYNNLDRHLRDRYMID